MKRMKLLRLLYVTLYSSVAILLGLTMGRTVTGCSTSAQRKTVMGLFATGQSVDTAYRSYLDLVVSGQVKTNDLPKVSQQYREFQAAFAAAVLIAGMNTNAPPSPELMNAASQVTLAITAAKQK